MLSKCVLPRFDSPIYPRLQLPDPHPGGCCDASEAGAQTLRERENERHGANEGHRANEGHGANEGQSGKQGEGWMKR